MAEDAPAPARCDVLVVDDQLFHREMVCEMLRAKGFAVETVASGEEAIALYAELAEKPLVLMDNLMPKMSGTEATAAIRSIDTPSFSSSSTV